MMNKRILLALGLIVMVALVIAPPTFASPDFTTPSSAPQQDGDAAQTWYWPELGLSLIYPLDWQSTLSQQNFDFVLFGPPFEGTEQVPYVTLQSSTYDPDQEDLAGIFAQIAGEGVEVTEITFAGDVAWQFEMVNDTRQTRFVGFGANENNLALMGMSSPPDQWETLEPTFEAIVDQAELEPITLDHEALNEQMLANFEEAGVIGIGNLDAPVRVAEFMDFSCPHCVTFSTSMSRLIQDYAQSEDVFVEIVVLDIIGGEASRIATGAQLCGIQFGVGWDVHEIVFDVFTNEGREGYTVDNLVDAVAEGDVDIPQEDFAACVAEYDVTDYISDQLTLATEESVSSTPSLLFANDEDGLDFIRTPSGDPLAGGLPLLFIYDHIDNLLAQAAVAE